MTRTHGGQPVQRRQMTRAQAMLGLAGLGLGALLVCLGIVCLTAWALGDARLLVPALIAASSGMLTMIGIARWVRSFPHE